MLLYDNNKGYNSKIKQTNKGNNRKEYTHI